MTLKKIFWFATVLCAVPLVIVAEETNSDAIVFQGKLSASSYAETNPLKGTHTLQIGLYAQPSGGDSLWTCTVQADVDAKGNFAVEVKDQSDAETDNTEETSTITLREALAQQRPCYMGVRVDDGEEILPRTRLSQQPRVLRADSAEKVAGVETFIADSGASATRLMADPLSEDKLALTVTGTTTISGDLSVGGQLYVTGGLQITGASQDTSEMGQGQVPVGTIVAYAGEVVDLPEGWAVCDGTNGTPDLRGRFIMGAGNVAANTRGGAEQVTLTVDQIPSHAHSVGYVLSNNWRGNPNGAKDGGSNYWRQMSNTTTLSLNAVGGGQAHNNLPPYRVLRFIMRVR